MDVATPALMAKRAGRGKTSTIARSDRRLEPPSLSQTFAQVDFSNAELGKRLRAVVAVWFVVVLI